MAKIRGQYCAILFDGHDISGRTRQFEMDVMHTEEEATAFQDGAINSQGGLMEMDASVITYMDPDESAGYVPQSHNALNAPGGHSSGAVFMVFFGANALPDEGDEGFAALVEQFTFNSPLDPKTKVMSEAAFRAYGATKGQFGKVMDYVTITNTKTSDTVDGGAANADGGTGFFIVFLGAAEDAPGTDIYTIKIQHNTVDNGSWVDYFTAVLDGSVRGSERQTSALNLNQFRRLLCTRTGAAADSVGIAVLLAEN